MPLLTIRGPRKETFAIRVAGDSITLGRAPGNDVMLEDPALSRTHAIIRRRGDGWVLQDAGSRNGTRLNGLVIDGPAALRSGDEIGLGTSRVLFEGTPQRTSRASTLPMSPDDQPRSQDAGPRLLGRSAVMQELLELLERVAVAEVPVLLTGESGTGKELAARFIHQRSPHASGPFVAVSCPALPSSLLESELFGVERGTATGVEARAGRFELAAGGSIFLDEVGDLDVTSQAKLLRVLEERVIERVGGRRTIPLDARIIAATNRDLATAIAESSFRRDLYHRLNVIQILLPPLRARRDDIPLLVEHFLSCSESPLEASPEVLAILARYPFPGNVRELEHLIERARLVCRDGVIRPNDLPAEVRDERVGGHPHAITTLPVVVASADVADDLYERIVRGHESFWDAAGQPFLRRQVTRAAMRAFIQRAWEDSGRSYRAMAEQLGLASEYKRLLNFLNHHRLGVERPRRDDA